MDRTSSPGPPQVGRNALCVQQKRDLALALSVNEEIVDSPDSRTLVVRTGYQHHTIGLQALRLPRSRAPFG